MSVRDLEFVVKEPFVKQSILKPNVSVLLDTEETLSFNALYVS